MIKKFKNLDPMTKQFAVAAAIHVATTVVVCTVAIVAGKKNPSN